MIEVKWYQHMGIDVCKPADIDIDVLMSIYLYIPHSKVEGTEEGGWRYLELRLIVLSSTVYILYTTAGTLLLP